MVLFGMINRKCIGNYPICILFGIIIGDIIIIWLSFINAPLLRRILPFLLLLNKNRSRPKTWHIEAIICIDEIAILKTCQRCTSFRSILQKPLFFRLSGPLTEHI